MNDASRPTLTPKARLRYDRHRDAFFLLWPERGLLLNRSASEILTALSAAITPFQALWTPSRGNTPACGVI